MPPHVEYVNERPCRKCWRTLPLDCFYRIKQRVGYTSRCKECMLSPRRKDRSGEGAALSSPDKFCRGCHTLKPKTEFHVDSRRKDGLRGRCKACCREQFEEYQAAHGEVLRENAKRYHYENRDAVLVRMRARNSSPRFRPQQKEYRRAIRQAALDAYGGKCSCCGESHFEFMAIDHIGGGGAKHRREIGGRPIDQWLRANNYPEGFRVLCHNCNMALGKYGACPHEALR